MLKIMRKGVYLLTAILYVMLFSASLADASVTWVCPTCGNVNRGNFCPVDGTEKPRAWICESCRSLNNQNFCERCGAAQSGINVDFTITFDGASMADSFMDGDLLAFKTADPAELQRFDVVASLYPGRGDTLFVKRLIAFPGETFEIADGYVYIDGNKYDEPFVNDDYRVKGGSNGYSFAEIDVPKNGDTLTLEYTDENRNRVAVYIGGKMWSWRGVSSRSIAEDGTVLKYDKDGSLLINGEDISADAEKIVSLVGKRFYLEDGLYFIMGDHRNNSNDSRAQGPVVGDMIKGVLIGQWRLNEKTGNYDWLEQPD